MTLIPLHLLILSKTWSILVSFRDKVLIKTYLCTAVKGNIYARNRSKGWRAHTSLTMGRIVRYGVGYKNPSNELKYLRAWQLTWISFSEWDIISSHNDHRREGDLYRVKPPNIERYDEIEMKIVIIPQEGYKPQNIFRRFSFHTHLSGHQSFLSFDLTLTVIPFPNN